MARISEALRQQITERASGLCEYCQTAELIVVTLEVDHIIPQAAGGENHPDNLCLVCRSCNSFKQDFQVGIDPDTNLEIPLFNPRIQPWEEHFRWSDDRSVLIGLTAIGRATIQQLRINREAMLASRRVWVEAGWHPPRLDQFSST